MNFWSFMVQNRDEVAQLTLEHLWIVGISTMFSVGIGVPLGILITRRPKLHNPVIITANIIQTIPSLALFGFLLPTPWIGDRAGRLAVLALTLYALLPLIRNTYAGIKGVDRAVVEAARGMGLTDWQLLCKVELPLALPVFLSGLRIAAVQAVGLTVVAALIGDGGLGALVFQGLASGALDLVLLGVIPVVALAVVVDAALRILENSRVTPSG